MSSLLVAGLGLQAAGQVQQGRVAEAQGKFAKDIGVRNKQALDRQAEAERVSSGVRADRIARKEKFVKASQRASGGKSGFGFAGSSLSFLADTAFQFFMDKNLALRGGLLKSRELTEQGNIELAKGRWARSVGKAQKRASILGAAGSGMMAAGIYGSSGTTSSYTNTKAGAQNPFA